MPEIRVQSLGWGDRLEKEMAIHSSILAWRIPWTEKPDRLQSMRLQSGTPLRLCTQEVILNIRQFHSQQEIGKIKPLCF